MQSLQMALAGPSAINTGTASGAALPGNAGAGDNAEDAGGSLFGAILAGQIKDQVLVAKSGMEAALPEKADADKVNGLTLDDAAAGSALSDLLAFINAGATSIQITPTPLAPATTAQDVATQRAGDQLALPEGNNAAVIAGLLATLNGTATGKMTGVNDIAAKAGNDADAAAAIRLAGLPADKIMGAAGSSIAEGFAAAGKTLPTVEPAGQNGVAVKTEPFAGLLAAKAAEKAEKTEEAGRPIMEGLSDKSKTLPAAEPISAKPALEALMPGKSAPAGPEAAGVGANDPLALLAMPQTAAMAGNQANAAPAPALEIAAPVGSPGWGNALADKVAWMSSQGNQVAELHLNPPHLGPLEVQLTITNDQASAVFVSHHPAVREAIEAAMPRLREMLADNGIMLGNTMVGAESFQQQQQQAFAKNSGDRSGANETRSDDAGIGMPGQASEIMATKAGKGMVDTFV